MCGEDGPPRPRLHVTPLTIPSPLPLPLSPPVSPAPPGSDLSVLVIDSHAQDLLGVCLSCLGTHACTRASVRSPSLASSQHTPISEECSGCCFCCAPSRLLPKQSRSLKLLLPRRLGERYPHPHRCVQPGRAHVVVGSLFSLCTSFPPFRPPLKCNDTLSHVSSVDPSCFALAQCNV